MQTCKKCLHYEVCRLGNLQYQTPYERYETKFIKKLDSSRCGNFKDSSKFIELPYSVKLGDKVYFILNGLGELDLKEYTFTVGDCAVCDTPDTIIDVSTKGFFYNGLHYRNEDYLRPDDCDFVPWEELEKTAFLTREEAEQALKNHIADVGKKERNDESQ